MTLHEKEQRIREILHIQETGGGTPELQSELDRLLDSVEWM
jgi:hypothetical protein